MASLAVRSIDSAFESVKKLIFKLCYEERRRTQRPFDECLSEAFIAFEKAWKSFDGSRGIKFTTWVARKVRFHFLELNREERRRYRPTKEIQEWIPDRAGVGMRPWELSQEAQMVTRLILETPKEIQDLLDAIGVQRTPKQYKKAVWRYLRWSCGWSKIRIERVFSEISEALIQ